MKFVLFYHSLVSDWNHGNAHFLRGVARELLDRGHEVEVYEPREGWSISNLRRDHGEDPLSEFRSVFPRLESTEYDDASPRSGALEAALDGADLVIVHEWNRPELVRTVGALARGSGSRLLFHDTHHRSATDPAAMAAYDLSDYDGVLAFGEVVRRRYLDEGWAERAWTWHEAADVRLFRPMDLAPDGDLVWVGNWGDEERTRELRAFLLEPVRCLRDELPTLSARAYGVRYPPEGKSAFEAAGFRYEGWLPNHRVPEAFARHRATVHVPRRPYTRALPGIPTIRVFEALACGIPLVSSPWDDVEGLFEPGEDYLVARTGAEMRGHLRALLHDPELARSLADSGRRRVLEAHTCGHRVERLLEIHRELAP